MFKLLCDSMTLNKVVTIKGFTGMVNAIEKEDGSGKCFNVTMLLTQSSIWREAGEKVKFFVRIQ